MEESKSHVVFFHILYCIVYCCYFKAIYCIFNREKRGSSKARGEGGRRGKGHKSKEAIYV